MFIHLLLVCLFFHLPCSVQFLYLVICCPALRSLFIYLPCFFYLSGVVWCGLVSGLVWFLVWFGDTHRHISKIIYRLDIVKKWNIPGENRLGVRELNYQGPDSKVWKLFFQLTYMFNFVCFGSIHRPKQKKRTIQKSTPVSWISPVGWSFTSEKLQWKSKKTKISIVQTHLSFVRISFVSISLGIMAYFFKFFRKKLKKTENSKNSWKFEKKCLIIKLLSFIYIIYGWRDVLCKEKNLMFLWPWHHWKPNSRISYF